ncbi:MAG: pseudouridine synthase [Deltaproteobacteria bacterium]|nr:pseudouridine synthase [Deltaproteobacteria bacterium]
MSAERVQKLLAGAGLASRRAAEAWIRAGRVRIDGTVARLGDRADPASQTVTVDGRRVALARHAWWIVHKPRGVLTTVRDREGRRTVMDLLPPGLPRLFPVGRLDFDTEGLVLLTNDGTVAHALLHPSLGSEREYQVTARGRMSDASLRRLAAGVELDDGPTAPARVGPARFAARAGATRFVLAVREGRKRQIRRALAALGHPVVRLVRTRMGPQRLGRLPAGGARPLTGGEVRALERHAAALARQRGQQAGGRPAAQGPERPHEARRAARAQPRGPDQNP